MQLGANIVFYAADQQDLRFKGETHIVADDPDAKTTASLKLARLSYKGNWDPEPAGGGNCGTSCGRRTSSICRVQTVALGTGSLDGVKVAHLTGTTKIKLDDAAKAQLKKFIAGGGTLDRRRGRGVGGVRASIEGELASLGTGAKLEVLPPDHSLFGGKDGPKIVYRPVCAQKADRKSECPADQGHPRRGPAGDSVQPGGPELGAGRPFGRRDRGLRSGDCDGNRPPDRAPCRLVSRRLPPRSPPRRPRNPPRPLRKRSPPARQPRLPRRPTGSDWSNCHGAYTVRRASRACASTLKRNLK